MSWIVIGAVALGLLLFFGRGFVGRDPARLADTLRFAGGIGSLIVAAVLAVTGRWAIAAPIGLFGLSLLGIGGAWNVNRRGRMPPPETGHRRSSVTTACLELDLDHASGEIRGRVTAGPYAGRQLDDLGFAELLGLYRWIGGRDQESAALLEAYLDRREPGWREDVQRDADPRRGRAAGAGAMSTQEAYETLGLGPGATEAEIRDAHRRLIKRVHPDVGGTAGLAAKINEAKERLLGGHRER